MPTHRKNIDVRVIIFSSEHNSEGSLGPRQLDPSPPSFTRPEPIKSAVFFSLRRYSPFLLQTERLEQAIVIMVALSNLQVRTKSVIYRLRWCFGGGGERKEGRKEAGGLGREIEEESVVLKVV